MSDDLDVLDLLKSKLDAYEDKKIEAEIELDKVFCAFTFIKEGPCFLFGGRTVPQILFFDDFVCTLIAGSNASLDEARTVLVSAHLDFSKEFTPTDFRPIVALDFAYRYQKAVLDDLFSPRALAVEYFIYDRAANTIIEVKFSGEFDIHNLGKVDHDDMIVFVIGAYHPRFAQVLKIRLKEMLEKCSDDMSLDKIQKEFEVIMKKLRIRSYGIRLAK